ncbi:MAG: LysE family transporter, partial [Clostridiaceae bacterium]|nr:LysE family transporter [Clostridiaceae bacterium]
VYSACVVTWFNPQAIIDGTMMLGAFYVTLPESQSIPFISGVVSASCLWFTGLTFLISIFSNRFNGKVLRIINIVCGIIIIFYGAKLFFEFVTLIFTGHWA